MPRPKYPRVLTVAPAETPTARAEVREGIEDFLMFANMTGAEAPPLARAAHKALLLFSEGKGGRFGGWPVWAAAAFQNIRYFVAEGGWHLRRCPFCERWLLAKDQRRVLCRRAECTRKAKAQQQASRRAARRDLDRGAITRARRTF